MRHYLLLMVLAAMPARAGEFSTFIGDTDSYHIARIQADAAGNTYIAGNRAADESSDAFVMKLNASGNIIVFNTFSGKGADTVNDLAVDAAGNFYVAGSTNSLYLPLRNPFQSTPGQGFVVKFSPDGEQVIFSTYFPSPVQALAVDASGNVYLTGTTLLPTFPVTQGMPADPVSNGLSGATGAFITKLAASGSQILYSGVLSGSAETCGCCSSCFLSQRHTSGISIAVDPAGGAYVAGYTDTSNLPTTTGALLATGEGAFVAKVNAAGNGLAYLTYLGAAGLPSGAESNPATTAASIAVDSAGNAYIAGATWDPAFPATKGAYQTTYAAPATMPSFLPPTDAFVLKLNPTGTAVVWASYLGGANADTAAAIAVDAAGNVWIAGTTASVNFPNAQGWSQGGDFVAEFNASGSSLPYAARYPNGSVAQSLSLDGTAIAHVAGAAGLVSELTASGTPLIRIFGVANSAYGTVTGQISGSELISIYGPHIGPAKPVTATADSTNALPMSLAGVQVLAVGNGSSQVALPLLYLSDSQINAVVPDNIYGLTGFQVVNGGATSPVFPFALIAAKPEIFQNSDGSAVAVNQDGGINSPTHPAPIGSIVSIWTSGTGVEADWGRIAQVPRNTNCCAVNMAGAAAYVPYAGDTPGAVGGVVQINFQVPPVPSYEILDGMINFTVDANGVTSHYAGIYVSNGTS